MSISGIQGQTLEVTVVSCNRLKDTEWISRQDPYVCLEYASTKYRTRTCTDGGKNPSFQEKFVFTLIEGLRELSVVVWNSNTVTYDDFIGTGKIQLQKVLSQGYDDSSWSLQDKRGRHAGEVRLIMHYSTANKPAKSSAPSAPPHGYAPYSAPSPQPVSYPPVSYPPPPLYPQVSGYPSQQPPPPYYNQPPAYPQAYPPAYPQAYPPSTPYPPQSAYPPSYPPSYPPGPYPPPSQYPPPPY